MFKQPLVGWGGGVLVLSVAKKKGQEERKRGRGEKKREGERQRNWKSVFPSGTHGNKWEQIGTCITPL